MKYATIEILGDVELHWGLSAPFGGKPGGKYLVREYETDEKNKSIEQSGSFYKTIKEAEKHVIEYQK
jgi:hypothetical protein